MDITGATNPAARHWCFVDQLGPHLLDDPGQPVLLIESRAVFERRRFHRRKAHLVLPALRHRAAGSGVGAAARLGCVAAVGSDDPPGPTLMSRTLRWRWA